MADPTKKGIASRAMRSRATELAWLRPVFEHRGQAPSQPLVQEPRAFLHDHPPVGVALRLKVVACRPQRRRISRPSRPNAGLSIRHAPLPVRWCK